ncbi:MAG: hypothetical protein V3V20_08455 [Algisphaera sp.]
MSLRSRIARRVWKRVFTHIAVAGPLILGVTAVVVGVATRSPVFNVAGVCLAFALTAAAMRYQRWGAVFAAEESEHLQAELQQKQGGSLDDLKNALRLARNTQGLQDVERLEVLSERLERGRKGKGFTIPQELMPTLESLRDACTTMLRKVVRLGGVSDDLSTPEAREQVVQLRANLLVDANDAITQLARTLDQLQLRAVRDDSAEDDLIAIRHELDTQLDVARAVEQRLEDLEQSLAPPLRTRER